jgi:hypothetical protein
VGERRDATATAERRAGPAYEPVRRSRPVAVLALVTAILAAGSAVFFGAFTEPEPPSAGVPVWSPSGTLVFVASVGADRARLWRWELSSGRAELGPIVDRPVELVRTAAVSPGSVGLTSIGRGGRLLASLLRFPGSREEPEPLISGDLVAWASSGTRVVVVRRGSADTGCRDDASRISSFDLPTEAFVFDLRVCAEVSSIARAGITTFFTRRSTHGTSIEYVGIHRSHEVLDGFTLLAASATGDLIVTAGDAGPGDAAQLYWQGNTEGPVPYASGAGSLFVDRVLAWSPDAGQALVLGRLGSRAGVWSIQAGASSTPVVRQPEFVVRNDGPTWAAYAADGTAYIEADGQLLALREGRLLAVQPPPGVPTPYGPLVWLP